MRRVLILALLVSSAFGQEALQRQIRDIAAEAHGKVTVACSLPGTPLNCDIDPHAHPPMQSVFKLPLALAVLHQVELGKFALDQPIRFRPEDLIVPKPYSPLQDQYPQGGVDVPLRQLLQMTVTLSDNTAADILLRLAGGPKAVSDYIASLGVAGFHLMDGERELHRDLKLQYRNWFEPLGAVQLLRRISDRTPLNSEHTQLLLEWMQPTSRTKRLQANLPSGASVAHKSGSSDVIDGLAAATNDIGLIGMPDGGQLAIAVFVTDSMADETTREQVIAKIGRAAYDAAARVTISDWPAYGGGPEDIRFSRLKQIDRSNVGKLEVAWSYDTADGPGDPQTQPIVVGRILFGITPKHKVVALDAATGKLLWRFDSGVPGGGANRSLVYWSSGSEHRIFAAVKSFIYALDADTGKPIASFGQAGRIDLREGLGRDPAKQSFVLTSPGIIYQDLLIVGGRLPESLPAAPGDVRAYDVRTGKVRWSFHTIPHPGEFGYDTWPKDAWTYTGAANNWAGMAVDAQRGIVYVPTGSAASDFYGADRKGDDLFANCLLALNAKTGARIWHFQSVKHDIWDRDFPSPPSLVTVRHEGQLVDAVAQTTKSGFVYLFDRANGKPLFPIEYRKYPASDVPGEVASETQPLPTKPAPFARQSLNVDMLTNRTPAVHEWAVEKFREFRSLGQFIPLTVGKETVVFPGFDGGAEWGGSAFDPETGLLYVNANDVPWTSSLAENVAGASGKKIYLTNCANCHGDAMLGAPPSIPSLVDLQGKRTVAQITTIVQQGSGRMPSFPNLSATDTAALARFVLSGENKELQSSGEASLPKYRFTGYHKFRDPDGYPAVAPPWGTLNAINLNTGEYAWKVPLGEYPELVAQGLKDTGSENYGGPIVTAGGLVFIAATNYDRKFRAFDKSSGKLLWETTLPFAGNATPVTYEVDGKQYVVIYATGGKSGKPATSGGIYVAFALPR